MSSTVQTVAALTIVAITVFLLLRPLLKKRDPSSCGSGCGGCPTTKIKAELRRSQIR